MKWSFFITVGFLFGLASGIWADVHMPAVFFDNMVLQQKTTVNFWGKANAGEVVVVTPSWGGRYQTVADEQGQWSLAVKTPGASTGHSVSIKADNTIEINNVLIGEVWICSGQSNMDFQVAKSKGWRTGILNEEKEMQDADYPEIRLFHVTQKLSPLEELDDCEGYWVVCNRENLKEFSAVAFFFGRKLFKELNQPVGLIQSTWGGTHAESWTKMEVMQKDTVYAVLVQDFYAARDSYAADMEQYEQAVQQYENLVSESRQTGGEKLSKPVKLKGIYHNKALSTLWNAMIHPLVPYTIKGVVWYQGESNSIRHQDYQHVFTKMIDSWRYEWGQGAFPFYFVQIAPHYKQPPQIRDAQLKTWQSVKKPE